MKVVPVQTVNPSFNAKLAGTKELNAYRNTIDNAKVLPFAECFNGLRRLRAIEHFPTQAEVKLYTTKKDGSPWAIYGVIESQYAKYVDPEPVADKNSLVAISNILKRIFEPENADKFGKLLGVEDVSSVEKWQKGFFSLHRLIKIRKPVNPNPLEESYANWFRLQDGSLK